MEFRREATRLAYNTPDHLIREEIEAALRAAYSEGQKDASDALLAVEDRKRARPL